MAPGQIPQLPSQQGRSRSKIKELLHLLHGVFRRGDGVTDGSRIAVNLPIIAAGEGLVAEEVDVLVGDAGEVLGRVRFGFNVLQAVSLVPALGKDVERDLAANGISVWSNTGGQYLGSSRYVIEGSAVNPYVSVKSGKSAWMASIIFFLQPDTLSQASNSSRSAWLALRPTGLTLIMPFRNSTKVPRILGMPSMLAMYFSSHRTSF